ncbi:MAG: AraC family transcriptional regulator [Hyphomonadaceae bacterium JAD_PAG50586_4]|nr:MAG: AraC family transcriptional regulator [Hyphomonadaceae bacterium JAD_PAG50586_4]
MSDARETASSSFVLSLLDFAVSKGADRCALLARAEIDAVDIADRDSRIAYARYRALMRAAKDMTNDPAIALHFGEAIDVAQFSIIGLIGQASNTMMEAFDQLSRYVRLIINIDTDGPDRFVMRREESGLWMYDMRSRPNDFPELGESAFAHIVTGPRQVGVPEWVREAHFTHAAPTYVAEYERVFGAPVHFSSDRNAMRLEERIVEHRLGVLPRYVFGVLTEHADALMKELEASETIRGRVERLIMPMLHTGEIGVDTISAQLGVSRQTLYRNLKSEDVTFEQVLDDLRHRLALEYLRGRKASVTDTAYLVGFSDPAAFSRAFKRWTGKSPRDARK